MSANALTTVIPRKLKLPRDASIQYTDYPPQLYLNMTITRVEHIEALRNSADVLSPAGRGRLTMRTALALLLTLAITTAADAGTRCRSTVYTVCEGGGTKAECRSSRSGSTVYTTCR